MFSTLVVGLALVIAAPGDKDAPKKDAPSILGVWEGESLNRGGMIIPVPAGGVSMEFAKDGKLIIKEGGTERKEGTTYKVDTSKSPAQLDLIPPAGAKDKPLQAIYKIEDGKLIIALTREGADRPSKFETAEGSMVAIMTLKPAKAEKK